MSAFRGFGKGAVAFYDELEDHNERSWWLANKVRYDTEVRGPLEALLADLADEFGEAKVFRPNRDTRFSKDKAPYKLNAAAAIQGVGTALYLSLGQDGLHVAGGSYRMARDQLARYRAALDDDRAGAEVDDIVTSLRKAKADVGGHELLKTAPRGFTPDHPRIELLRADGLTAGWVHPPAAWLSTPKAAERVAAGWRAIAPLNDWLARHVGPSELEWSRR